MTDQPVQFRKTPGIMSVPLGGSIMIMDAENGHYYELRDTGRFLWDTLDEHSSADAVVQALCAQFDVSPEVAREDTLNLLADLTEKGLVQRA